MPFVLNSANQYRFKPSQYLEVSQVKFLFAKFAQQKRENNFSYEPTIEQIEEEMDDQVNDLRREVVDTIQEEIATEPQNKPLSEQDHPKYVSVHKLHTY